MLDLAPLVDAVQRAAALESARSVPRRFGPPGDQIGEQISRDVFERLANAPKIDYTALFDITARDLVWLTNAEPIPSAPVPDPWASGACEDADVERLARTFEVRHGSYDAHRAHEPGPTGPRAAELRAIAEAELWGIPVLVWGSHRGKAAERLRELAALVGADVEVLTCLAPTHERSGPRRAVLYTYDWTALYDGMLSEFNCRCFIEPSTISTMLHAVCDQVAAATDQNLDRLAATYGLTRHTSLPYQTHDEHFVDVEGDDAFRERIRRTIVLGTPRDAVGAMLLIPGVVAVDSTPWEHPTPRIDYRLRCATDVLERDVRAAAEQALAEHHPVGVAWTIAVEWSTS